jgi:long-chain acyl-CoA synthetase
VTQRIWLKSYAEGVPAEADWDAYPSLVHLLQGAVARYRDKPAFTNMGTTLSFREVDRLSCRFASYLQQDAGLVKGDRLAIMLPNLLQYPVALFGALRAGLTVVNVNPLYTPRELEYQLRDSDTRAIVVLENFAHTVESVLHRHALRTVITTGVGDLLRWPRSRVTNLAVKYLKHMVPKWNIPSAVAFRDAFKHDPVDLREVDAGPDDVAFLQYTSGTTGAPKGAMLTHRNVIANVRQNNLWSGNVVKDGEEVVVTPLPLYHVLSLMVNLFSYFNFGGHNILITNPRDLDALIKELTKTRFSVIIAVNTLYNALLNAPAFQKVDVSGLKSAVAGGAAVQRSVAERWKTATGVTIVEGYGLTEAGVLTCNRLDSKEWNGTVGLPYPSTEISVRDSAGKELPGGEIGELCARGPQVMRGYWNLPQETAEAFTADNWFRTGDMGYMDEKGMVTLVDRKKDMIVVSGFKVYPTEIENVLATHPGVLDAAAIGVPDDKSGEAVKVLVVKRHAALTSEAVMAHCRRNLTPYKCPKYVEFRNELPKSPIGKVLRKQLREASQKLHPPKTY